MVRPAVTLGGVFYQQVLLIITAMQVTKNNTKQSIWFWETLKFKFLCWSLTLFGAGERPSFLDKACFEVSYYGQSHVLKLSYCGHSLYSCWSTVFAKYWVIWTMYNFVNLYNWVIWSLSLLRAGERPPSLDKACFEVSYDESMASHMVWS